MGNFVGVLVLAVVVGPVGRWVAADPVPMSMWMRVAAGVVAVEIWAAIPDPPGSSNPVVFVSSFCFPLLFAAALVVGYRTYTWTPSAEAAPAPLPRRWLWKRVVVSIATLPVSLLVMATYLGLVNANPVRRGVLEAAVGVSLSALVLVAIRWGSSHWWSRRVATTLVTSDPAADESHQY